MYASVQILDCRMTQCAQPVMTLPSSNMKNKTKTYVYKRSVSAYFFKTFACYKQQCLWFFLKKN